MLDIMSNIDPINFIIQEALDHVNGAALAPKNNFFQGEGYAIDVVQKRKNSIVLRFRAANLQNICTISIDKKSILVRYAPEFFLHMGNINDGIFSSNVVDEPFTLDELKNAFIKSRTSFDIGVDFEYDVMIETLQKCRRVHYEFIRAVED